MTESPRDPWGERLSRRLGLWSAVAELVGSTIGSGIFRTPASVAQRIDDVPLFLLAWVVGNALLKIISVVLIEQEADRAELHAVHRNAQILVAMQGA